MDENRMKYENRTKTGMKLGKQDESKILISPSFYSLGGKKNHFFSPPDILYIYLLIWASLVVQMVKNHLQCGRLRFHSWVRKIPWRRQRLPIPVFWPGEFNGLYSPWGRKDSDMTDFHFHCLIQAALRFQGGICLPFQPCLLSHCSLWTTSNPPP